MDPKQKYFSLGNSKSLKLSTMKTSKMTQSCRSLKLKQNINSRINSLIVYKGMAPSFSGSRLVTFIPKTSQPNTSTNPRTVRIDLTQYTPSPTLGSSRTESRMSPLPTSNRPSVTLGDESRISQSNTPQLTRSLKMKDNYFCVTQQSERLGHTQSPYRTTPGRKYEQMSLLDRWFGNDSYRQSIQDAVEDLRRE